MLRPNGASRSATTVFEMLTAIQDYLGTNLEPVKEEVWQCCSNAILRALEFQYGADDQQDPRLLHDSLLWLLEPNRQARQITRVEQRRCETIGCYKCEPDVASFYPPLLHVPAFKKPIALQDWIGCPTLCYGLRCGCGHSVHSRSLSFTAAAAAPQALCFYLGRALFEAGSLVPATGVKLNDILELPGLGTYNLCAVVLQVDASSSNEATVQRFSHNFTLIIQQYGWMAYNDMTCDYIGDSEARSLIEAYGMWITVQL
jgi:hypothetical protein